ncbi:hypothetical protein, partial [Acidihalobacter prosperus]
MSVHIAHDDFDPVAINLGLFSGLLKRTDESPTLELKSGWFEDPLGQNVENEEAFAKQRREALLSLLDALLGSMTEAELGIPVHVDNRLWYPVELPTTLTNAAGLAGETELSNTLEDAPTALGLYLVTAIPRRDTTDEDLSVGMGFKPEISLQEQSHVHLAAYAYLPLLKFPTNETDLELVLGRPGYSIEVGTAVSGSNGDPLFEFG